MADLHTIPRVQLAFTPTPLQDVPRLANALGLRRLLLKRDDQTGLALGGNKARKLEFLLADAIAQGADTLVTMGGPQSNHCRMTAAAARACGLQAQLVFNTYDLRPVADVQGNMILDRLLGAAWRFTKPGQTRNDCVAEVAAELTAQGHTPYVIPAGGSNGLGVLGYVKAALELAEQCRDLGVTPDYIVCAGGGYGTQAGLELGVRLAGLPSRVVGVAISPVVPETHDRIASLVAAAAGILEASVPGADPLVWEDYVGDGYGVPTQLSRQALELVASVEGILLDPVYTAKAFSGLMGGLVRGRIKPDDVVVFVHTGGAPALFAEQRLYWGPVPTA
jgi:D-cysteine desulfhydrase family pyridoxal phosphate-dependent enzyme